MSDEDVLYWLDHLHERSPEGAVAREAIREVWASEPERLLTALREARYVLRGRAADALGMIGDAAAVPALIEALGDEVDAVRGRAASALGKIGDSRATEPLLAMLRDEDVWLRWAAADALGALGDPVAAIPLLEAWLNANHEALLNVITDAFKQMGDVVRPTLQMASNHPEELIRRAAAYMLGQMGE